MIRDKNGIEISCNIEGDTIEVTLRKLVDSMEKVN